MKNMKGGNVMKTVICYDGSRPAKKALGLIPKYVRDKNAKVYIFASMADDQVLIASEEAAETADAVARAEKHLEYAKEYLESNGIAAETHLHMRGLDPGEDIVDFADEIKADYIVLGIARKLRLGKMIFGSAAQYVILNAHCPVLSVN
jgi:nucleotide-binding universal stress UspA family protein